MERTPHTSRLLCFAAVVFSIASSGCGKPWTYHFKHYHRPFAAIAESNQTYFHSQQTGRIIEKDPCATYCEPGCYGFEPTTWTHWPSQCPGSFPVQGEVLTDQISANEETFYGEVAIGSVPEGTTSEQVTMETTAVPTPVAPGTVNAPAYPAAHATPAQSPVTTPVRTINRGNSIRLDNESSIPSPSDASNTRSPIPLSQNDQPGKKKLTQIVEPTADPLIVDAPAVVHLPRDTFTQATTVGFGSDEVVLTKIKTAASRLSKLRGITTTGQDGPASSDGGSSKLSLRSKLSTLRESEQPIEILSGKPIEIATKPLRVGRPSVSKPIESNPKSSIPVAAKTPPLVTVVKPVGPAKPKQAQLKKTQLKKTQLKKTQLKKTESKQAESKLVNASVAAHEPIAKAGADAKPLLKTTESTRAATRPSVATPKLANATVSDPSVHLPLRDLTKPKARSTTESKKAKNTKGSQVVIKDRPSKVLSVPRQDTKARGVVTMTVSDFGDSTLRFSKQASRKPLRISAAVGDKTSIRFR